MSDKGVNVPKVAIIDGFADTLNSRSGGIDLKDVPPHVILEIRTQNSIYTLMVLDLLGREVMMQGGKFLPEMIKCHFGGSSIRGGSFLKHGWIGVGLCMEFHIPGSTGATVTSPVRQISIVAQGTKTVQ